MLAKSNYPTLNTIDKMKLINQIYLKQFIAVALVFILFFPELSLAQTRAGVAFLKIMPGVRNQGLGSTYTGVLDDVHSAYANPGATGFIREWQWASNYTEWIADTYSLSWTGGARLRTPFTNKLRFAFGVHYQGVRDFNSTADPNAVQASANDALFNLSLGTPIVSDNLSVGTTLKYFRSDLDGITASAFIADLGLLLKSNRMDIDFLNMEYAIFSGGFAVNQLGSPMDFIGIETPLPRTLRTGVALNLGSHDGLQMQLSADYLNIRDEDNSFSFGAEVGWSNNIGIRGGYNFNDNILSKFSLGVSYRWGDTQPLPGQKNALKLDFAYLEGNEFFDPPIRGGLNHFPIGPERFRLGVSDMQTFAPKDTIQLYWEQSRDPDLFDDVSYALVQAKDDSAALGNFVKTVEKDNTALFDWLNSEREATAAVQLLSQAAETGEDPFHRLPPEDAHQSGDYYWTVFAYDRDNHVRSADNIGHYRITLPDIKIHYIEFEPVITENCQQGDPCSGEIRVLVSNIGNTSADDIKLHVYEDIADAPQILAATTPTIQLQPDSLNLIGDVLTIPSLQPKERIILNVPWQRSSLDVTSFIAIADPDSLIEETSEENNIVLQGLPFPDLNFKVVVSPDSVYPGDEVEYTLIVNNDSKALTTAKNIDFEFETPEELKILEGQSSVSGGLLVIDSLTNVGRFSWSIDSLRPGQNASFGFKAKVPFNAVNTIRSNASLYSDNCDINPADNCIPHELPILRYDIKLTREVQITPLTPNVNFKTAKYELTADHKEELEIYGRAHRELETVLGQKVFIKLGGHTDQVGRASSNQTLSENRVNSVADYFITEFGVPKTEGIFAHGYGENALLERRSGETNRQKNARDRRVELYFLKTKDTNTEKGGKVLPNDSNLVQITEEDPIEYTITIKNNGPDVAKLIKVKVDPGDDAIFVQNGVSNPAKAEQQRGSSEWHIKNLGVGDDHKIEIRYQLTSRDVPGKVVYKISHTTTVSTDHTDESGDEQTSDTLFVMKKPAR